MQEFIIEVLGYMCLWAAGDVWRYGESKIQFLSGKWFVQLMLIVGGVAIINAA